MTVISHFTGDLSQLAAMPAPGKLSPCHLFKFQTLFCDQFQNISVPQILNISIELCRVARSSLALLSRQQAEFMQLQSKLFCIKNVLSFIFGGQRDLEGGCAEIGGANAFKIIIAS